MRETVLELSGASFSFIEPSRFLPWRAGTSKPVLSDVSFAIGRGEILALLGASGIGKSTLLRIAAGLITPTQGTAIVCGLPSIDARKTGAIGYLPQKRNLLPWKSLRRNIEFPVPSGEPDRTAEEIAGHFQIADVLEKRPTRVSGGQESRAALARAFIRQPRLLLLDEPFGSLDYVLRERLWRDFRRAITANDAAAVLTTHDIREAQEVGDTIAVLCRQARGAGASIGASFRNETNASSGEKSSQRREIEHALRQSYFPESPGEDV